MDKNTERTGDVCEGTGEGLLAWCGRNDSSEMSPEKLLELFGACNRMVAIRQALPLLCVIVQRCGGQDTCHININRMSEALGVDRRTLTTWRETLEAHGIIDTHSMGRNGTAVKLHRGSSQASTLAATALQVAEEAAELLGLMREEKATAETTATVRDGAC
ncbi:hypothetical protein ACFLSJ_00745 [Verrucomicrobiota bacterium]